jgi:DNA-binding response OmpR family regulator/HPt (histidine-containing phosphotransfer) domain-containing protein
MEDGASTTFREELRLSYTKQLRQRLEILEPIAPRLARNSARLMDYDTLMQEAHKLSGTGATYGYEEITKAAEPLERVLRTGQYEDSDLLLILNHLVEVIGGVLADSEKQTALANIASEDSAPRRPRYGGCRPTILIADDDPDIRNLVVELLGDFATVIGANNGRAALAALREQTFDLALLDYQMPDMTGLEILDTLNTSPFRLKTPIMILTANRDAIVVSRLVKAGAADYIVKPFNPNLLIGRVKTTLSDRTPTVVVADDDPLVREILGARFRSQGVDVLLAANGAEALAVARKCRPQALILDWSMPRMDGLQVLQELRKTEATQGLPILMLSARNGEADIATSYMHGVDDYVTKPFLPQDVVARCISLLPRFAIA